jgi:hypothetical protein
MAPAHWLCAVEFGAHTQAVDVGVGNAVWSHFAVSAEPLVISVEKFVLKPAISCDPSQPHEKAPCLCSRPCLKSRLTNSFSKPPAAFREM